MTINVIAMTFIAFPNSDPSHNSVDIIKISFRYNYLSHYDVLMTPMAPILRFPITPLLPIQHI
ncbi:hypothetical protein D3OALGB2SA_2149 [Olavius algarvensis associated proteobacterium Delta 3]|nr:hypothetical protein D3OALGB2SA_2149 [Olavius algarvensis associated proteobacterium Delta 3]